MLRLLRLLIACGASALLASCATTPLDEKAASAATATQAANVGKALAAPAAAAARNVAAVASETADPLRDPNGPLAQRSVYFDFDEFLVKPEYAPLLARHGKYLVSQRSRRITIEGHADERGSREYNLALGQRRADAVKRRLELLGVQQGAIETVSFGEERPRASEHDESAWAQNRRADISYR